MLIKNWEVDLDANLGVNQSNKRFCLGTQTKIKIRLPTWSGLKAKLGLI